MEQQLAVVIERIGTIEETNEEIMENVEELAKDTSTDRRLTFLEEKQAGMEKMQLELVSYQESLKGSVVKLREYTESLNKKVGQLGKKQKAEVAEQRRKRLEERLRSQIEEEVQIQEIPRDKIIKIERPAPRPEAGIRAEAEAEARAEARRKKRAAAAARRERARAEQAKKKEELIIVGEEEVIVEKGGVVEEKKSGFILEDF